MKSRQPMTAKERFTKFRASLLASGGLDVRAYLGPEAAAALRRLTADGSSMGEAIARALILADNQAANPQEPPP